jgi:branched-chain amino acid transport system permease protein
VQRLLSVLFASLLAAGLYATIAYGLAVIYGVMRIINLAHAGLMMLGAYVCLALNEHFGLDPLLGVLVVGPLFFLFGLALYFLLVRRVPHGGATPSMQSLLLLFGLWLILQNVAYWIWSGDTQSITTSYTMSSVELFGEHYGVPSLLVFGESVASLAVLKVLLEKSELGRAIRAVTQNRDAARLSGVDADRIAAVAFGIGCAFAASAGCMLSTLYAFTPDFGRSFLLKAFCIIVMGGLESFTGVAAGALGLALIENLVSAYTEVPTAFQDAISFSLLALVLVAAPGGLPARLKTLAPRAVTR